MKVENFAPLCCPGYDAAALRRALDATTKSTFLEWLAATGNVFGSVTTADVLVEGNADEAAATRLFETVAARLRLEDGRGLPVDDVAIGVLRLPLKPRGALLRRVSPPKDARDETNYAALLAYQTGRALSLIHISEPTRPY